MVSPEIRLDAPVFVIVNRVSWRCVPNSMSHLWPNSGLEPACPKYRYRINRIQRPGKKTTTIATRNNISIETMRNETSLRSINALANQ
jgi:hypothetical protein